MVSRSATEPTTSELRGQWRDLLQRLQYWLPQIGAPDWQHNVAASWRGGPLGGGLRLEARIDDIALTDLRAIDRAKTALLANTQQFVAGLPANNALLWGARGTGKSSLIHAILNELHGDGLRLVEIDKQQLDDLPDLARVLGNEPYRFIVFCDDLSFEPSDASYKAIKSALDGSVFRAAPNMLIYATSNRRHLLPESMTDNLASTFKDGELHAGEGIEEKISLSDRFGLWLSFYQFNQDDYLTIAEHWVGRLAASHAGNVMWDDTARRDALRWALARGVRSGRTAQHFARHWVGQALYSKP